MITRYRQAIANLRTHMQRIVKRAGLASWQCLFHNLRASRQTELATNHPLHVVCYWLGNSAAVADKHYPQVTDDHYWEALNPTAASAQQKGRALGGIRVKKDTQAPTAED